MISSTFNFIKKIPSIIKKRQFLFSLLFLIFFFLIGTIILLKQYASLEKEKEEFIALEKEKIKDELIDLQSEYGFQLKKIQKKSGYGEQFIHLSSENLLEELGAEKAKVERLSEELKANKNISSKKIKKLSNEVRSLRKVLRSYIIQADSLQQINLKLQKENSLVKKNFQKIKKESLILKKERNDLSSQLAIASLLQADNIKCETLNKRGRRTRRLSKIRSIKFSFSIKENISAKKEDIIIGLYIVNPLDQSIFSSGKKISYEGKELYTNVYKKIFYGGEKTEVTIYWNINESLIKGTYNIYIFANNKIIGEKSVTLE